jgi:hypothetical protein
MGMRFRDSAVYNLPVADERGYLQEIDTVIREVAEDPRNGGGSS